MTTRANFRGPPHRRQGGTAAVEMALLSFVMAFILLSPIMIARFLMQVSLAQRAAYNAVHMIATYPAYQRLQTGSTPIQEATAMLTEALVEGGINPSAIGAITPYCTGSAGCASKSVPVTVALDMSADLFDPGSVLPTFSTVTVSISAADRYAN